ncbi:MAG: zinc ribbon domain-containing protein [Planctomycetia bacterium]|nr:zinc ribbon domain-containing protein [Planctomycetia bacterium]
MPIYEYVCEKCMHEFEELVTGSQKPKCPSCNSVKLRRKLSVPSSPHGNTGACGKKFKGECGAGDFKSCASEGGHHCCGGCCHHS